MSKEIPELTILSAHLSTKIPSILANKLDLKLNQVQAAINLFDQGAAVPFIARYRKEETQSMDAEQLRTLQEELTYVRELHARIETVLHSIESQGQLNDTLKEKILQVDNKTQLEDLYLPYKPKRRTKGQIAIEKGLEPLAEALLNDPTLDPQSYAVQYIDLEKELKTTEDVLAGAQAILMERFAQLTDLIIECRHYFLENGVILSSRLQEETTPSTEELKFKDYFLHQEPIKSVPSHRMLAMLRGRHAGYLKLNIQLPEEKKDIPLGFIAKHIQFVNQNTPRDKWLSTVIQSCFRIKLHTHLEVELISQLREQAETEAIKVFAYNLKNVLMAPPAGHRTTIGIDPGFRTGIKLAVLDNTGKILESTTLYPHAPQNKIVESACALIHLCKKYPVELISIGNGTASRETEKFVQEALSTIPEFKQGPQKITIVMTSEAGASVYSASPLAIAEFPELDVTIRGAISIGRRLQDPLAELVKIDPKSIGVGQYQHDVNQSKLTHSLNNVVEDCVNAVGVNVNTASSALLSHIAGLNKTIADNIIDYRETHGAFSTRNTLKKVPRLGTKAFEQAAGFLRIVNGDNPLDQSSVHPEAYPIVQKILDTQQCTISDLMGNSTLLKALRPQDYIDDNFGILTIQDVLKELEKPGHDPRAEFKTAEFKEGIETIKDLKPGMILKGVVTNVANFGAFVDIGVHQDGLVHISLLSNTFVKDPKTIIKTGDIVDVKVIELDIERKRISLSMILDTQSTSVQPSPSTKKQSHSAKPAKTTIKKNTNVNQADNPFAQALKDALSK